MLGKPKYEIGDMVTFEITFEGKKLPLEGKIEIIDDYGSFSYEEDVCYDILVEDFDGKGKCLCKHIPEKIVSSK